MHIYPAAISHRDLYQYMVRLITPRPIAWVSTISNEGVPNLAPFSYFNAVGSNPPTLMFCPANRPDGGKKDTLANIEQNGEFVVNVVSFETAETMNQTSANYEYGVNEIEQCGLTPLESKTIQPPRVAEAKAQFECTLHTVLHLGTGPGGANMVIGNIQAIHVRDDVLNDDGLPQESALDNIGRLGGFRYTRTRDSFEIARPTK